MDDEDMQFSIVESSVDSELSSAIVTLLKLIEDQGKLLPVVDIIYEFLTSRFGMGWYVVAAIDSCKAIRSPQYYFIIEDSITNADIICFKPNDVAGTIVKQDTTSRVTIPPGCSMSVLDTSLDKVSQADVIALIHEVLHSSFTSEEYSVVIRTRLIDKYGSLFHVICSETSPIAYQMDGRSMLDYIYLKHGMTYILIWESSITEENLLDHRMTRWFEKHLPFYLSVFIALGMLMYLASNVGMSVLAEKCESCQEFSDENLLPLNMKIFSVFIVALMTAMFIFMNRNKSRKMRMKEDRAVMERIIKKVHKRR